jgi:putative ABC transport system permease protein
VIQLALRGMAERKLRSALTALAVLLGVAMISGTYVLTDQIRNAFGEITETANEGRDAIVSAKSGFESGFAIPEEIPGSLVERVEKVPGVESAAGQAQGNGALIVDGEPVRTQGGAPNPVFATIPEPFDPTDTVEGRDPGSSGEITVSRDQAEDNGIEVGDELELETAIGAQPVTVVGLVDFGGSGSAAGYGFVGATPDDVDRWYEKRGKVVTIAVAAQNGVSDAQLVKGLQAAVPGDVEVETGEQNAQEEADEISNSINSFLGPALLAFAGAALLVGAFIIFNTFSISVAERTHEFATLRTLGATRLQVLGSIAVEALMIGVLASVIGLFAGLGFAKLLGSLFGASGFPVPTGGLVLKARTVLLALGIGIVVTLVACVGPAARATRVPPAIAVQEGARLPPGRLAPLAPYAAALVSIGGIALLVAGLFGAGPAAGRLLSMAIGAVLIFVGLALIAKYVVRPVARVLGLPLERLSIVIGRLARENAQRNPGRTAITAAALMVGLGLVVFVAVFTNSLKASIGDQINRLIAADLVISGDGFQPIPRRAAELTAKVRGVEKTSAAIYDQVEVNGRPSNVIYDALLGVEPATLADVYRFDWLDGDDELLGRLRGGNALVEEQFAKAREIEVGDSYEVVTPSGGRARLKAIGMYKDPTILQGMLVDRPEVEAISPARDPYFVFVKTAPDVDAAVVEGEISKVLERFPVAKVETLQGFREETERQTDQIVYLLYALLAMSVVISLFGIANSLFLSIHERTREFGLLRAIGATRRQVRRMVRYESAITAAIGGMLGTIVGLLFGALITASLSEFGLLFRIPFGQLVIFLVLAVIVGIVAAVLPARRGARLDPLEALHYE